MRGKQTMFAITLFSLLPIVDLDTLTLERARELDGKLLIVTFIIDQSGIAVNQTTFAVAAKQPDHILRLARLKELYPDLKNNNRITTVGLLKVSSFRMCGGYGRPWNTKWFIEIWEDGVKFEKP